MKAFAYFCKRIDPANVAAEIDIDDRPAYANDIQTLTAWLTALRRHLRIS